MRTSLPLLLLASTLTLGCTGASTSTTATEPEPAEKAMSITEPWKSMNLPIDGAIVLSSTKVGLDLSYPTHTQETASGIVGVLSEAFEGLGYTKGYDSDSSSAHRIKFEHPSEGTISLSLDKRAERPSIKLTKR